MFLMLYLIFTRAITVGQFFSLFIYSFFIFGPLQELGNIINIYRETEASLNVYQDILRMPKEPRPVNPVPLTRSDHARPSRTSPSSTSPRRRRRSATSRSPPQRGETIALVGPSGAGRRRWSSCSSGSTSRSPDASCTTASPDGHRPRRPARADRLRDPGHAALLRNDPREPAVREPAATDAECLDALRKAACHNLLARADRGLDTVIGEGGVKVSGGEKQRLSIARALLRKPHLLVFDEATSSLDSITEEGIVDTIRDVASSGDTITVLIAHRLSTILHADRIYVLERGHIVETGRHQDLVDRKGLYYAMWRQQIGERRAPADAPRTVAAGRPTAAVV